MIFETKDADYFGNKKRILHIKNKLNCFNFVKANQKFKKEIE